MAQSNSTDKVWLLVCERYSIAGLHGLADLQLSSMYRHGTDCNRLFVIHVHTHGLFMVCNIIASLLYDVTYGNLTALVGVVIRASGYWMSLYSLALLAHTMH